jgi:hypothetical protein
MKGEVLPIASSASRKTARRFVHRNPRQENHRPVDLWSRSPRRREGPQASRRENPPRKGYMPARLVLPAHNCRRVRTDCRMRTGFPTCAWPRLNRVGRIADPSPRRVAPQRGGRRPGRVGQGLQTTPFVRMWREANGRQAGGKPPPFPILSKAGRRHSRPGQLRVRASLHGRQHRFHRSRQRPQPIVRLYRIVQNP